MMIENNMNWRALSDPAIVQEIGKALKMMRLRMNITQKDLAENAGLDRTTVIQFERGRSPNLLTMIQMLRQLSRLDVLNWTQDEVRLSPLEMWKVMEKTRKRASRVFPTGKGKRSNKT
jgi:transcriptional regulator with XRE-family HTH domain